MARYLVTGIAGFIASRVAAMLLDDGHTVVGIDNMNDAYDVRLKRWRLEQLEHYPQLTCHTVDIYDRVGLSTVIERSLDSDQTPFDAVINLAARAGVRTSVENPWIYFETNTTGTLNLLEICRQYEVKKFMLASTSSLYGHNNPQPYAENANTDGPLSPYAASKKAAEALAYTYHYLYGIDVSIARYFTVYGPAGRPDMSLFRFVQWISEGRPVVIFGDGTQGRDFTYVDDIARGTIAALRPVGYDIVNLGSDSPVALMDAIQEIEELCGKKALLEHRPRHPADVPSTWADIGKARSLLGWQPEVRFTEGVARLVDWYKENASWASQIATD